MTSKRVFVSHATADQGRFVRGLAERLVRDGFDTWYAEWSLLPGDSLIDRIFNEGLSSADVVIVVLSRNSIASRWVTEELNTAKVRQIAGSCRLVPVVLDDVEVPTVLLDTVWQSIPDLDDYEPQYERLVAAVLGTSLVPQPAPRPTRTLPKLDGLSADAVAVLLGMGERVMTGGDEFFGGSDVEELSRSANLAPREFLKALHRLGHVDYVDVTTARPGGNGAETVMDLKLLTKGFYHYLLATGYDINSAYRRVVGVLVNEDDIEWLHEIVDRTSVPAPVVDLVLKILKGKRLAVVQAYLGGPYNVKVHSISPLLEDELM